MMPMFGQETVRDREREIRRSAEQERRLRADRHRADPPDLDGEIRALIQREERHPPCSDRTDELAREAG
ncbi:MAG TPA: hypothetical protein VJ913_08980 [Actinomycetota bacterium]|nr:hypothetical protein [Actinomycetota bacterium]